MANLHALNLLRLDKNQQALGWLKKSETLAESNSRCLAITYNNLACYYKKLGHSRSALQYLEKALDLEDCLEDASFKADTHLNLSAVLS
mmetsp:Transcript_12965/g.20081  ORF Transcript_12965/g.20081 Transcript_12965/m.20081 type:complete len:89 (+) Transcript_12965:170-436(+)